jgi:hypothetical protein
VKALAELLNAKPGEIRSFPRGQLPPGRIQEFQSEMLVARQGKSTFSIRFGQAMETMEKQAKRKNEVWAIAVQRLFNQHFQIDAFHTLQKVNPTGLLSPEKAFQRISCRFCNFQGFEQSKEHG